ncbi:ash family protein [Escherichia coli]|nr:ash family protein [Escherichia coli]
MTRHIVRGYIPHAPAKSGVGIGVPDIETVHNRAGGFFMR